jgi:hypothetical protein
MRLSTFRVSASAAACIAIATALLLASSPREFDRAVRTTRAGAQRLDAADSVHGHDSDHLEQPSFELAANADPHRVSGGAGAKAPVEHPIARVFAPLLTGLVSPAPVSSSPLGRPTVAPTGRAPPFA